MKAGHILLVFAVGTVGCVGATEDSEAEASESAESSLSSTLISSRQIAPNQTTTFNVVGAAIYRLQCFVVGDPGRRVAFKFDWTASDGSVAPEFLFFTTGSVNRFRGPAGMSIPFQMIVTNEPPPGGPEATRPLYCEVRR
jgi:hypothetical protein